MIVAVEAGTLLPPSKQTLAISVERWLTDAKHRVSPITWIGYRDMMTRYALPVRAHAARQSDAG
ncbi:MAG TPA: hypothetical protein VNU46_03005 [Gemmatimonadaceae bacterium]|nr:hypothetical protein [Gemmatimonadaceae bacterium]